EVGPDGLVYVRFLFALCQGLCRCSELRLNAVSRPLAVLTQPGLSLPTAFKDEVPSPTVIICDYDGYCDALMAGAGLRFSRRPGTIGEVALPAHRAGRNQDVGAAASNTLPRCSQLLGPTAGRRPFRGR